MTTPTVEYAEAIAVRTLLEADDRLTDRVGIGAAPTNADGTVLDPPYVVMTGSNAPEQQDRFSGPISNRRPSWVVHAVGSTELGAITVLGWVDQRLRPGGRGVTPVVPGCRTKPVRRLERPGNAEDDAVRPSVWYAIAVYGFESDPITP